MRKSRLLVLTAFVAAVGIALIAAFIVKSLWSWTVGDVFPGAVDQGLVAGSITWRTALKLTICLGLIVAVIRAGRSRRR